MRRLAGAALLAGSGCLFALAFPGPKWWILSFAALAPLLVALRDRTMPRPAVAGLLWGAGFFGALLAWLFRFFRDYGGLPAPLAVLTLAILVGYLSLFPSLFAHCSAVLLERFPGHGWALLPALWVAVEWVRGWLLSGFPWGRAGYALEGSPPLLQVASLGGVAALSFLIVLGNAALAAVVIRLRGQAAPAGWLGACTLVLLVGSLAFGARELRAPERGPRVRVGVVQASIPQDRKWSPEAAEEILARHEDLTRRAAAGGARIVFWPESSSPFSLSRPGEGGRVVPDLRYRERVGRLARDLGVWLLIGTVDYREAEGEARPVNAAVLVGPDGSLGGAYAKMHLVPFGEYVPWSRYLGFVNRIVEGAIGDFLPGAAPVVLDAGDIRIGASICYEVIFPDLIRGFPLRGANLLANLTNDAWFGTSAGPRQHFAMAVVRAVENRRYLVRAANTGISGLVDPRGRVLDRTGMEESRVLVGEVRLRGDLPPAARAGAVPEILCAILAAAALAATMLPARPSSREGHRR